MTPQDVIAKINSGELVVEQGYTHPADGGKTVSIMLLGAGGGGVSDTTALTLLSAVVPSSGTTITLTFNETVNIGAGGSGGFEVVVGGSPVTSTYVSGSGSTQLVYNLNFTLYSGQGAGCQYTQPGNGIENVAGDDLSSFTNFSVTNNSTQDESGPI